ncbi:MAG: molybdopterin molybdotransferase MoeA [Methanoregula sp.]|nr:MAG: molybdopterin molybdotransferase MoeA [Methanoregula sp.]
MSIFLKVVPVSEAIAAVRRIAPQPVQETVPLEMAAGRVLAEDVRSDTDIPGFDRSVVDGYAVRAADTTGASDPVPAMLRTRGRVEMGSRAVAPISPGECIYVPTGGVVSVGADAVVMVENTGQAGDEILIKKPVANGENVLLHNEDFSKSEVVLGRGKRISAQDAGVLAAAGCNTVPVYRQPVIGIISTGNELVPVQKTPAAGQVRDSNSFMAGAFVQENGCVPKHYGIIHDDRDALRAALVKAVAECDAVLISGGSSKDDRDMAAALIAELGEVLIHGIAIAPGKPTIIGYAQNRPVIGLPGHPASAFIVLIAIVRHLLYDMTGDTAPVQMTVQARLSSNVPSPRGREDYVRVKVAGGVATPVFGKSGLLNTLVRSNGVIRIPAESEGLEAGEPVEVLLW